ncbi:hypothetical protein Ddye_024401 [Dipteronia dyeriana]|uniref:Uncharacterized protein n=1 Tax=Dipteronia dyeriana TaxID=168575 RepID=A0AAD9TVT4_9ROSI|nr:hypothetical protein Ddye_024401 [Dipteronia dyeriana]
MAKMRSPCATLLILILVISSAPQPSRSSFNQYRTLLSLSHSLLKRVANLRAERGDISGSNRVKLISQKVERVLGLGFFGLAWSVGWDYMRNYAWRDHQELYGAVSDLNELMRFLSEFMRVDSEIGRITWVRQNYGNVLGVSKRLFVRLLKVFSQSGSNRLKLISQKLERGLELGFFELTWSMGSLGWDYMRNYDRWDQQELYGAVSDLNELMRCVSEFIRVDSEIGRFRQNYGNVLDVLKRLIVRLLKQFTQSGALREVIETVEREVVDGELLRDCLEVGSNDLKGLIQVLKDLGLQYYPSPSPDYGRDI